MLNEIKPEQVPKEAIAELRAFLNSCDCDDCVSVAIAAALNAWLGMEEVDWYHANKSIILPLTEASDE